jgi:predicted RNA-binding protein
VAVHAGEVRAVGVAQMPGPEMALAPEGEAVRVRHKL